MKVYVVTSGEYSDYGINAIFSTKEKAQEYIDRGDKLGMNYSYGYQIEEYELDENATVEFVLANYSPRGNAFSFSYMDEDSAAQTYPKETWGGLAFIFKVRYNPNISVMKKSVYDQYARFKAEKEGLV